MSFFAPLRCAQNLRKTLILQDVSLRWVQHERYIVCRHALEHQLDIEEQLIDIDSYGKPVIAGTGVTVKEILSKMVAGWFLGDMNRQCEALLKIA